MLYDRGKSLLGQTDADRERYALSAGGHDGRCRQGGDSQGPVVQLHFDPTAIKGNVFFVPVVESNFQCAFDVADSDAAGTEGLDPFGSHAAQGEAAGTSAEQHDAQQGQEQQGEASHGLRAVYIVAMPPISTCICGLANPASVSSVQKRSP